MDYNKFLYNENHKENKPIKVVLKEVRFRTGIASHDYKVNFNKITKWLDNKCKVKIIVFIKGKRSGNNQVAKDLFNKILEDLNLRYKLDYTNSQNGSRLFIVIDNAEIKE